MEIIYTDKILYISLFEKINNDLVNKLQDKVFKIIDDYNIKNIVLNIFNKEDYNKAVFNNFIFNYKEKYKGVIKIN